MHFDRMIYGMALGGLIFAICYPLFFKRKKPSQKIYIGALFVYTGALIFLTMLYAPPWNWNISKDSTWWALSRVNIEPFVSSIDIFDTCKRIGDYKSFIILIGGNLIMLMPLAILVPLLNPKFKFVKITLLAMAVSASIEGLQLLSNILLGVPYRTVEIDDFIQNVLGCVLMYIVFATCRLIYNKLKKPTPNRFGRFKVSE